MFIPLPDDPQPFGTRKICVGTFQGSVSYLQGGGNDVLTASQLGWGSIDVVHGSKSFNANNSGNYATSPLYPVGQAPRVANNNVQGNPPQLTACSQVQFTWVAANGTEAANGTNLSSEFSRVQVIGG